VVSRIYALVHPRTKRVRYVGKCITTLACRRGNHEYKARSGRAKTPVGVWIRDLQKKGLRPEIRLLEEVSSNWMVAERKWIAKFRAEGHRLLNLHPGGNGAQTRAPLAPQFVALLGSISDARIAEEAGLCREAITYHRRQLNIPRAHDYSRARCQFRAGLPPHNKKSLPDWLSVKLGKFSDVQLAREARVSTPVIQRWRSAAGIPPFQGWRVRGGRHYLAKLTDKQAIALRAEWTPGRTGVLALKYKVSNSCVMSVVNGRTYK